MKHLVPFDEFLAESNHPERQILAKKIFQFLETYGGIKADYDPKFDSDSEKYNSPDASDMFVHAQHLAAGLKPNSIPWSDWPNGGYKPHNSAEGRKEHDAILAAFKELR